jgi:hypothetical protein
MPIVFVHGVNTRKNADYDHSEKTRNELFRTFALDGVVADPGKALILNPYWGDNGAAFAWHNASLPDTKFEAFGTTSTVFEAILTESTPDGPLDAINPLLNLARTDSLQRAVDCLWTAAALTKPDSDLSSALAALAWKAEQYAENNEDPDWLQSVNTDDEFVDRLLQEVDKWKPVALPAAASNKDVVESFGISDIWNHLKTAALNLANAATAAVVNPAVRAFRPWAHHRAAMFLGDVFVYLKERGDADQPGAIVKIVTDALKTADAARKAGDDNLIVVAHSMGGNIVYDILTHYDKSLTIDLWLTVASQVGLFEELKLFHASDKSIGTPMTVAKPANVKRWINVLDPSDMLAYSTSRIFADSPDTEFHTGAPVWSAHSMYFYRPSFHKRLAVRIKKG